MNQPPLNPDALEAACLAAIQNESPGATFADEEDRRDWLGWMRPVVSAYLAAALPEVTQSEELSILIGDVKTAIDHEHIDPREFIDLNDVLLALEAQAKPEVTSVEQWGALPIGTMVRVHFNGNSEIIIRCPAGSGAGIGGMSFLGGRHWNDVFTVWNADKLEIKYVPDVTS